MTQPNLLKLAQQGDPDAIAALMNLTLEPKGVIAKTFLEDHCLHVFLSASRVLNAKTLVAFIQRGILRLEVASIQQVQVYGQRVDTDQLDWVETFVLPRSQIADALEALSHPSTTVARHEVAPNISTPIDAEQKQPPQSAVHSALRTVKQLAQRRDRPDAARKTPDSSRAKRSPANYVRLSVLVTLAAFMTGGTVALIANSYTVGSSDKTRTTVPTIAGNSQLTVKADTERNRDQQQATARNYLETMNTAQQTFYRQKQRFALTLEELERFAAVPIATRSDYSYKLTVPNSTQSQLTAIPKADGLKSYTAAVSIAKPTNQAVTAICASPAAAKVPPLVFQSTSGAVQCPV
ncbi:MAG: type IV pilin-like G/H family protein [Verrucomicrobia bacterium]|nr:type IV pilin-like G/H family protein [Leptolyngbya sp. ES-bin-22]